MTMRLSKLFGMDIYTDGAEYRGKIFDLVINLEKGKIETITTEALRARNKAEAINAWALSHGLLVPEMPTADMT